MKYIRANTSFEEELCQARLSSFCFYLLSQRTVFTPGEGMVAVLACELIF